MMVFPDSSRLWKLLFRKTSFVLVGALLLFRPTQPRAEDAPPPTDLGTLEKDLKRAMAGQLFDSALAIVEQLGASGDPRATEIIIQNALSGASYALEKAAGAVLLSLDQPAARAKVLEGTQSSKNPKPKSRMVLFAVAAKYAVDDPAAFSALTAGLMDPAKPIVLAVIKALKDLGRPESVPALIGALEAREKTPHDRVYMDIQRTLKQITGADLYSPVDWKSYWDAQNGAKPAPKRISGGLTSVVKRPKFFSVSVDSDRVIFIIDISKSMLICDPELAASKPRPKEEEKPAAGLTEVVKKKPPEVKKAAPPATRERLTRVKVELINVINSLEPTTRFGILSFNHQLAWWGDGKAVLKDATAANKSNAVAWVKALVAEGATRTDLALESALSLADIDTIYLLTDGSPKDEHNQKIDIEPILARTKETNRFLRCRIHTVSFAQIVDPRMVTFLKQLAGQNDGVCTFLP